MHYEGNIIRPPSEAESILLQITVGCSYNRCTFCGAYKGERFRIKSGDVIADDIAFAARHFRDRRRVFLCDGDALAVPQARLVSILEAIGMDLPWVSRVGTYANARSIGRKSDDDLRRLRDLGLRIIHMGLESGDDETLRRTGKYGDAAFIVDQGLRARAAGIKLFVTVINGLGGLGRTREHAFATGLALSRMNPEYVGALTLMLMPGTPLYDSYERGEFVPLDPAGVLREIRLMIEHTDLRPGYFYANHASNYLPIRARLPRDRDATLKLIDMALGGAVALRPEWVRGL